MEIKREYLQKYLDNVAIDQIADEYSDKGYQISRHEQIGKSYADLVARKDNETIIIEVKSGKMTPQKKAAIAEISDLVRKMNNYKFFVVFATPPQKKKLEVSNIDELLENYLLHNLPDELDQLSTHTRINDVTDVIIDEIIIQPDGLILVKGNGLINVSIQYKSDNDQENDLTSTAKDNFSFDFEVILFQDKNKKFTISKMINLAVDTSGY